jgi:hypothetical protein
MVHLSPETFFMLSISGSIVVLAGCILMAASAVGDSILAANGRGGTHDTLGFLLVGSGVVALVGFAVFVLGLRQAKGVMWPPRPSSAPTASRS